MTSCFSKLRCVLVVTLLRHVTGSHTVTCSEIHSNASMALIFINTIVCKIHNTTVPSVASLDPYPLALAAPCCWIKVPTTFHYEKKSINFFLLVPVSVLKAVKKKKDATDIVDCNLSFYLLAVWAWGHVFCRTSTILPKRFFLKHHVALCRQSLVPAIQQNNVHFIKYNL